MTPIQFANKSCNICNPTQCTTACNLHDDRRLTKGSLLRVDRADAAVVCFRLRTKTTGENNDRLKTETKQQQRLEMYL